jgi:hypothetical protein
VSEGGSNLRVVTLRPWVWESQEKSGEKWCSVPVTGRKIHHPSATLRAGFSTENTEGTGPKATADCAEDADRILYLRFGSVENHSPRRHGEHGVLLNKISP